MTHFYSCAAAVCAVLLLSGCAQLSVQPTPAKPGAGPEVSVTGGTIVGVRNAGIDTFLSIPYAAPPVGALRWRAPQSVVAWKGVYDATAFRHDCMQKPFPFDSAPLKTQLSEDCLFVNVWAPANASAGGATRPVMVWIHGGGFVNGGTSSPTYDGAFLARKGVILVSLNYRLGRFGFFGFPALSKAHPEEAKGNYGYMDQIAALKWVQDNIAAFGGDPGNVTVFGESAGGGSVHMLLTSPMAKGLFAKAIIESGGGRSALMGPRTLSEDRPGQPSLETIGVNFAEANGITGTGPDALAALRALPADKVVAGLSMMSMMAKGKPTYGGPILDGKIVVEEPQAAYEAGHQQRVPLMIGATSADLGFGRAKTMGEALAPFGKDTEKARKAYDPENTGNVALVVNRVAADKMMIEPARYTARVYAASGVPSYEYRFSYVAPEAAKQLAEGPMAQFIVNKGAQHASEIPYVMNTLSNVLGDKETAADKAMADAASSYWVNFAKTGNPNGAGLPPWPAYTAAEDVLMNFTQDHGPLAMPDPWKIRLDLTEKSLKP